MSIAHFYPRGYRMSDELRTFTVADYHKMAEVGILHREDKVELIDGLIYEKHSDSSLPRRFTVDEYYKLAEVGILGPDERVELIDGVIYRMSPIGSRHAACVDALAAFFHQHVAGRAVIRVQSPIFLPTSFTQPEPDVALLHPRQDRYRTSHPRPEQIFLVIEVMDASALRDRGQKLTAYAQAAITELWLVDLAAEVIHAHHDPRGAVYGRIEEFRRGQTLAPAAFPDAGIDLNDLFGPTS